MFPHQEKLITWDEYGLSVQGEEVRMLFYRKRISDCCCQMAYAPAPTADAYDPLGDTAAMDTSPGTELCDLWIHALGIYPSSGRRKRRKRSQQSAIWSTELCASPCRMMILSHLAQLTIACGIFYIDFEGRSDGQSIKNIISNVAPRRLVRDLHHCAC